MHGTSEVIKLQNNQDNKKKISWYLVVDIKETQKEIKNQ